MRKSENINSLKRNNSNSTIKTTKTTKTTMSAKTENKSYNPKMNNVVNSVNIIPGSASSARKAEKIMNIGIGSLRITERKENKAQIDKIYESLNKNSTRTNSAVQKSSSINNNKIISFNVSENKNYQKNQMRSPSYGTASTASQKTNATPRKNSQKTNSTPRKTNLEYNEISSLKIIGDSGNNKFVSFNSLYNNKKY